jgi:hypothetical protein
MSRSSARKLAAIVGAGAILVVVGWLDTVVIVGISRSASQTFDPFGISWAMSVGYLIVAGAVLAIALLARWVRSVFVGAIYVLVGAFLVFLAPLNWEWAATINGAAPVLPGPIVTVVSNAYLYGEQGPLNAVAIIGAAMLLVGASSIAFGLRTRPATPPHPAEGSLASEVSPS